MTPHHTPSKSLNAHSTKEMNNMVSANISSNVHRIMCEPSYTSLIGIGEENNGDVHKIIKKTVSLSYLGSATSTPTILKTKETTENHFQAKIINNNVDNNDNGDSVVENTTSLNASVFPFVDMNHQLIKLKDEKMMEDEGCENEKKEEEKGIKEEEKGKEEEKEDNNILNGRNNFTQENKNLVRADDYDHIIGLLQMLEDENEALFNENRFEIYIYCLCLLFLFCFLLIVINFLFIILLFISCYL
jgi:hypothetical protein